MKLSSQTIFFTGWSVLLRPYCKFLGRELGETHSLLSTLKPPHVRKIIYTTNLLAGFKRQLRKVTQNRSVFPNDQARQKLL